MLRIFPEFLKIFRALLTRKRRPQEIHQKSPPFSNAKSPGKYEKNNSHNIFLESRQSNCFLSSSRKKWVKWGSKWWPLKLVHVGFSLKNKKQRMTRLLSTRSRSCGKDLVERERSHTPQIKKTYSLMQEIPTKDSPQKTRKGTQE